MLVSDILDAKGTAVETVAPHRTMAEIVAVLVEKKIGALVVVGADGEVLGMISERDVIRALAGQGAGGLQDAVSRHMTARVTTAGRDTTVNEAMQTMTNGRFRHLPVVEGGRLHGLVSIGDVVKHRIDAVESENRSIIDYIATA